MKYTRLILLPSTAGQPAPFLVFGDDGTVVDRGQLALDVIERLEPMRTVAVTPGADVVVRWLDLPAGSAAQMRAAAAWSLRDDIAVPADRLAVALGPQPPAGTPRMAAVAGRAMLEAWTDYLDALGAKADVFIPDVLTFPEPEQDDELFAVSFGDNMALRGRRFAATVQHDLVDAVAGGRRVRPLESAGEVERALIAAARTPIVNLLDAGGRSAERAAGSWRRAAVLAAAVVLSPLVLALAGAVRDDVAARRLNASARAAVVRVAPDLASAPDPVEAFRRRTAVAAPPGGATAAAAALFSAVEGVEGAELDILIADPEDGVKATVSYPAYQDMAAIKARMADAGMSVTETSTLDDAGRVVSDISIGAAQ